MKMFCATKLKKTSALAAALALLPFGSATAFATPVPSTSHADSGVCQSSDYQSVAWDDAKRRKLRRAYWLLNESDRECDGHNASLKPPPQKVQFGRRWTQIKPDF